VESGSGVGQVTQLTRDNLVFCGYFEFVSCQGFDYFAAFWASYEVDVAGDVYCSSEAALTF